MIMERDDGRRPEDRGSGSTGSRASAQTAKTAEARTAPARDGEARHDGAIERLRRRDEMLQVLFWLEGEGFDRDMTPAGVRRFLGWTAEETRSGLEDLADAGFAARMADGERYELTEAGRREGGRRFVSEFASILSRDTHHGSECADPECECHTSPLGAAACTGGTAT